MTQFKGQQLEACLRTLRKASPGVRGSVISSIEGLPIAADLELWREEELAARATAMVALGERIAEELGRGTLHEIFVAGSHGLLVVMVLSMEASLTVLCNDEARVAMTLLDVSYCAEELRRLL